jgi:hypothetical protein
MLTVESILDKLKALDLAGNPYPEAKALVADIQKYGLLQTTLHPNKIVIRARPNKNGERFLTKDKVSFKPQEQNKTYQRASTPHTTMFYGCVVPELVKEGEPKTANVTAVCEASELVRNDLDGEETVTFGRWEVIKDIPLISIVYSQQLAKTSHAVKELNKFFLQELQGIKPEFRSNSLAITEFFANEFAKEKIRDHTDYLLSAVFSERMVQRGHAGVYYPSVRTEGAGVNVAIHPDHLSSMELRAVVECVVYKKGDLILVDNETSYILKSQTDTFGYKIIEDPEVRSGPEIMRKALNGEIGALGRL